jgi:hypothetical protein
MLKYARLKLFQHFLRPYQVAARRRRSRWFTKAMSIEPNRSDSENLTLKMP